MKLTAILLLVACLQVGAAGHAQQISISGQGITLKSIFQEIQKQTDYSFFYTESDLEKARRVSIHARDAGLEEVLELVFREQPLAYSIIERTIVVKAKVGVPPAAAEALQQIRVTGRVVTEQGEPLEGVSVTIKGSNQGTVTDRGGHFVLGDVAENAVLVFSGVQIETREVAVQGRSQLSVTVRTKVTAMDGVKIVSTGYQTIPKERATGSFSTIDRKQLDNRPVANVLNMLEGYASGLVFHRNSFEEEPKLVVRGRSTIYANDQPLIVVDGFPIEGDINSINPNDIQSITMLKDAAAASIWGVRAGNGVIVIVTKKGRFNQKPSVSLRSQFAVGSRPDVFYMPQMSTSDFIDLEQQWFEQGKYDYYPSTPRHQRPAMSEVVSILFDEQNGAISSTEAQARLNALRGIDVRHEANELFYRPSLQQQQLLSVQGGAEWIRYFFSAGYDKSASQTQGNDYHRITVRSDNTFRIAPKLDLSLAMNTTWGKKTSNGLGLEGFQGESSMGLNIYNSEQYAFYPYQRLRDEAGNAVAIARMYDPEYNDYLRKLGFEDWGFRPADELNYRDNTTLQNNLRLATGLEYRMLKNLKLDLKYQFEKQTDNNRNLQSLQLFSTRNQINEFMQILPDSSVLAQMPRGDILDQLQSNVTSHVFRGQMDYTASWGQSKHSVAAIGGMEIKEVISDRTGRRYYGYDDRVLSFVDVDNTKLMRTFPYNSSRYIPSNDIMQYVGDRYVSFYSNASYTLLNRYTASVSGRMDKSNLFGVNPKDRNVPLWSAGLAWDIVQEDFLEVNAVSDLKLRATYGFNGNIDKNQTAFPAAYAYRDYYTGLPVARVYTPANPMLQWEKINQVNIGADFGLWNNALSGSVEYYHKRGIDLLGDYFLDPSSGWGTIRSNVASMRGSGFDVELNARAGRQVRWESKLLLSHARDRVTDIAIADGNDPFGNGTMKYMTADRSIIPLVGHPVYSIYSYKWAGLDAEGNPQLYDGEGKIGNYTEILTSLAPDRLVYHGPAQPTYYGGWSNTVAYKGFSLSGTLTYKFGHKFRRNSINYTTLSGTSFRALGHSDYAKRWQQPGDEATTQVPGLPELYSYDQYRDPAYLYSDILIEDASHIRLKDITLAYDVAQHAKRKLPFKGLRLYVYVDNIGILWKANKHGIDPDYVPLAYSIMLPAALQVTGGINVDF